MSTICRHAHLACAECAVEVRRERDALFNTAKKVAALVEVNDGFAMITDAHEFAGAIKRLKELTHV